MTFIRKSITAWEYYQVFMSTPKHKVMVFCFFSTGSAILFYFLQLCLTCNSTHDFFFFNSNQTNKGKTKYPLAVLLIKTLSAHEPNHFQCAESTPKLWVWHLVFDARNRWILRTTICTVHVKKHYTTAQHCIMHTLHDKSHGLKWKRSSRSLIIHFRPCSIIFNPSSCHRNYSLARI